MDPAADGIRKGIKIWICGCVEQVRETLAIAAPESLNWRKSICVIQGLRPQLFKVFRFVTVPDSNWTGIFSQVINVPVPALIFTQMTGYSSPHPAWPKRAADIDVVSRPEIDLSQAADLHADVCFTFQNQGVCSGVRP